MKLGVSYIVFDGIELLEYSIKPIKKYVDFLNVIYQRISWFGKKAKDEDLEELNRLKQIGLIDKLYEFKNFVPLNNYTQSSIVRSKGYERSKRQYGLDMCRRMECSYYLSLDVDEFYVEEQFKSAKLFIEDNKIDQSAVKYINYVNIPIIHRGMDPSYVPFICKIDRNSIIGRRFFVKCDPTRGVSGRGKTHIFSNNSIVMHHMETVRKDIYTKYESTTRAIFNRNETGRLVEHIRSVNEDTERFDFQKIIFPKTPSQKLIKVDNIFKIPYESWKK